MVSRNSRDEIVQHEMAWQREASNEADCNDHYLKSSKAINVSKNILEPHGALLLRAVRLLLRLTQKQKFTSHVHVYLQRSRAQFWIYAQTSQPLAFDCSPRCWIIDGMGEYFTSCNQ